MAGRKKENEEVYEKRITSVKKRTIYIKKKIEDLYTVYSVNDEIILEELKSLKHFLDGCIVGMYYTKKETNKNNITNGRKI